MHSIRITKTTWPKSGLWHSSWWGMPKRMALATTLSPLPHLPTLCPGRVVAPPDEVAAPYMETCWWICVMGEQDSETYHLHECSLGCCMSLHEKKALKRSTPFSCISKSYVLLALPSRSSRGRGRPRGHLANSSLAYGVWRTTSEPAVVSSMARQDNNRVVTNSSSDFTSCSLLHN